MPRLRVNQPTSNFHFTPAANVKQEAYIDSILLSNPDIYIMLGKEAGTLLEGDTVPANKTIKLVYGQAKSGYVLHLTPIQNDKVLASPATFYSKDTVEICLMVQTIKAVPVSELGTALLIGLST